MSEYTFQLYRPHMMTPQEMHELAAMVEEPFNWYAPDSTEQDIFDLLCGKGNSYVDVALSAGNPCGFLATEISNIAGRTVCYHIGVSILQEHWGKGLYRAMTLRSLGRSKPDFVVARTQNPAVYESLKRHALSDNFIYPLAGNFIPHDVREIAQSFSVGNCFEARTLILRDAHRHVRSERGYMKAKDENINRFFKTMLAGDDGFIVVVQCKGDDHDMDLFDLRVTVVEIRGKSVCRLKVGDYFEVVRSNEIHVPHGGHVCLYALASILPLIPAKQRSNASGDWIERDSLVHCPDPEEGLVWEIVRTRWRTMNSGNLT